MAKRIFRNPNYQSAMISSVVGPESVLPSCALRTGQNQTTTRSKNARIKSNQVRSAGAQNLPAPSIGQVPTTLRSGAISLTTACHAFLEELSTELTFSKTPLCVTIGIQETLRVLAPFAVSTVTCFGIGFSIINVCISTYNILNICDLSSGCDVTCALATA